MFQQAIQNGDRQILPGDEFVRRIVRLRHVAADLDRESTQPLDVDTHVDSTSGVAGTKFADEFGHDIQ